MADDADEPQPGEVKTGADRLLELVKASKEVSMSAAAKELGVSAATIEAWANFLEEDGLVAVKYNFTTPYIAAPEAPKAEKRFGGQRKAVQEKEEQEPEFHDFKTELDSMQNMLAKATEEKRTGEFSVLRQTHTDILARVRKLHDTIIDKAEVSPQKKAKLNEILAKAEGTMQAAASEAEQGRFDEANTSYTRLHTLTDEAIRELNSINEQASALNAIRETKDYRDMVDMAYRLMSEGNVEEASEVYGRLKFAQESLAKDFIEKKNQMEYDLAKLNSDLAKSASNANLEKLKEGQQRITTLLHAATKFLKKGELNTAEAYYLAIRQEYKKIPNGFTKEKKQIQEQALSFYSQLSKERESIMNGKFNESAKKINQLIMQTGNLLKENKISHATAAYKQLMQLSNRLPEGYLKEKAELQEKITALHTAITFLHATESSNAFKAKAAELVTLLGKMNIHTEKGELKEAEAAYRMAEQINSEMPKGFLHEETILQSQMVEAYEAYLQKAKQLEENSPAQAATGITHPPTIHFSKKTTSETLVENQMIKKAKDALSSRDIAKAREAYTTLLAAYRAMPPEASLEKTAAKKNLLLIYNELAAPENSHTHANKAMKQAATEMPAPKPTKEKTTPAEEKKPAQAAQPAQTSTNEKEAASQPTGKAEPQPASENTDRQTGYESGERPDEGFDNIEKRIEELKSLSKATVRQPFSQG